ncbi:hypothetical protein AgCh_040191 [Apium graveolens]
MDASLAIEGWVGIGVVARDSTGSVIFAATKRNRAYWSPEVAEAKAIDIAVRLGRKYGLEEVILESDCKNLVNRLSKGATYLSDLDYVLDDILATSTSFKSISWSHVKRDGNSVAHHLASSAFDSQKQSKSSTDKAGSKREAATASAAGTNNCTPALVGDGAGAPTSSPAAVTPTLEQTARTMKQIARTDASFELSIFL